MGFGVASVFAGECMEFRWSMEICRLPTELWTFIHGRGLAMEVERYIFNLINLKLIISCLELRLAHDKVSGDLEPFSLRIGYRFLLG